MLKYNNNRNKNDIKFYINELCIKKNKTVILSVGMFYNIADILCI